MGGGKEKHYKNKFSFLDCVIDFRKVTGYDNLNSISGSLEDDTTYDGLLNEINEKGKFDFSICTHTLEDLNNPLYVVNKLIQVSKSGLITVPSKYLETSRIERNHRGYYHHRYISTLQGDTLTFIPKTPIIENKLFDNIAKRYTKDNAELWILWENDITSCVFKDGWCGPSIDQFTQETYDFLNNVKH